MNVNNGVKRAVIATHNGHKTTEFRAMLGEGWVVSDLAEVVGAVAPDETGLTFEENARIKALAASALVAEDVLVLADDSGLEVDALGLRPGVNSSRYAGHGATDAENRRKLLEELGKIGARGKDRRARFRCVLVVARGGNVLGIFSGAVEGFIANGECGEGGFGYDSLFIPEGHCETFGELSEDVKNGMSHRAQALAEFKAWSSS